MVSAVVLNLGTIETRGSTEPFQELERGLNYKIQQTFLILLY